MNDPPLIRASDLYDVVKIALLTTLSWTVPERHWPFIARVLAGVRSRLRTRHKRAEIRRHWLMFNGRVEPEVLDRMPTIRSAHHFVARMQGFREYRPGGWNPEIQLVGAQHIETALARGCGVILWITQFAYRNLVTKKGLHEAGYRVSHLSRPSHDISGTRFGICVLNPVWTRVENRYLAERVTIRENDTRSALTILRARLAENRIVSIAVGAKARRTADVDLLGTKLRLATGPLHLARTTNAVLLPVFTVMRETGAMVVNVERPLMTGDDDQEECYESVAQRYARTLERYLLQYPDQWEGSWGETTDPDRISREQLV
jgi:lauroyl/myristoyl acyltransferase